MTSNRCQRCGLVNFVGTAECRRCKEPITWGAEGNASQPAFSSQPASNAGSGEGPASQPEFSSQPAFSPSVDEVSYQQRPFQAAPSIPNHGLTPGGYVSPYAQGQKLRSGLAIASLVLGVIGIFSIGLFIIGSLIGLILGIRAAFKAKREPSVYGGKGLAIGGIITNSLGILSIVPVGILLAIAVPNFIAANMAANEAGVMKHLRSVSTAEFTYQATAGNGHYGTMEELITSGMISAGGARDSGYQFKIKVLDRDRMPAFELLATPDSYGATGRRSFYASEEGVILCGDKRGREATRSDPPWDGD